MLHRSGYPLIPLLPEFYHSDAASRSELVEEVKNCCLHNGFFQITGHKVPVDLQKKMMDWNKKFFSLPLEEKNKVNKGESTITPVSKNVLTYL